MIFLFVMDDKVFGGMFCFLLYNFDFLFMCWLIIIFYGVYELNLNIFGFCMFVI